MGKQAVSAETNVKKETKNLPDGTQEITTTTTTVTKYSDGSQGTATEVRKETRQGGRNKSTPAMTGRPSTTEPSRKQSKLPLSALPDEKFLQSTLKAHNDYRTKHKAPPLAIDIELCKIAQEWANKLAKRQKMEHSDTDLGENIFWASNSVNEGHPAVDSWYREIQDFKWSKMEPQKGTGHFTQLIWKESKKLGVGRAFDKNGATYVVCNYEPAGNFIGHYGENLSKA